MKLLLNYREGYNQPPIHSYSCNNMIHINYTVGCQDGING